MLPTYGLHIVAYNYGLCYHEPIIIHVYSAHTIHNVFSYWLPRIQWSVYIECDLKGVIYF